MAVVKCIPVNSKSHLMNLLDYVQRDNKTLEKEFVSNVDCQMETAYADFEMVRKLAGKTGGILAHQVVQSYKKGEVSPEVAHEISCRLAEKMFSGFQYTVCTHIDREHIHSHIILNSVNMETGKKYCSNLKSLSLLRKESNILCREYGLSVIDEDSGLRALDKETYELATKGKSWKVAVASTLDKALASCNTKKDFIAFLTQAGYTVHWKGKHIVLEKDGHKIRVNRLANQFGMQYHKANIEKALGIEPTEEAPKRVLRTVEADERQSAFAKAESKIAGDNAFASDEKIWFQFMKIGTVSKYRLIHSPGETSTITVSAEQLKKAIQVFKYGGIAYSGIINKNGSVTITFKERHNKIVAAALGVPEYNIRSMAEQTATREANRLIREISKQGNLELYRLNLTADEVQYLADNSIPYAFYRNGLEFKTVFFKKDLQTVCALLDRDYTAELQKKEFLDNRIVYSNMKKTVIRTGEKIEYRVVDKSVLSLLQKEGTVKFAYFPAKKDGKYNLAMLPAEVKRYEERIAKLRTEQGSTQQEQKVQEHKIIPTIHRHRHK